MNKEKLDKILEMYKPDCKYLVEVNSEYPKAQGKFKLNPTYYVINAFEHMTSIEVQLCLNQLCYSAFGDWFPEGKFEKKIYFDEYLELMKENMFIINSNIRFKKPIKTNKEILGQIKLTKTKTYGNLCLAFLDYDLEQGKSVGRLELALKLK